MKKPLLIGYIMISSFTLFAQVDSTDILNGIDTIGKIAEVVAPKYSQVTVIATAIVSTVASFIIALVHRKKTVDKWIKSGKLK